VSKAPYAPRREVALDGRRIYAVYKHTDGYYVVYETENADFYRAYRAESVPSDAQLIDKLEIKVLRCAICGARIEWDAEKYGVPIIEVDPKYTSQTCPVCDFRPMTRSAGRVMACPRCGFSHDRDAIACMNLLRRLVDEGSVPLSPKPVNPHPEVVVLPMKVWVKAKSLPQTQNATVLSRVKR